MRKAMARALAIPVGFAVGFAVVAALLIATGHTGSLKLNNAHDETTAPAVSRVDVLIAKHDCWTGEAPKGVSIPGHVVATKSNGQTVYSVKLVGPALDQIFNHVDAGLVVHAFCR